MKKIRIIIADDQPLITEGIRIILETMPDMDVVATVSNGKALLDAVAETRPDLVLLDIQMPQMTGLEALKIIKATYPEMVILILTTFDPDEYIWESFRCGANGYLLKDLSCSQLSAAIRSAASGNFTIPSVIAVRIAAQIPKDVRKSNLLDYNLTQREVEIAGLLVQGYQNERIGHSLGISLGTTKNYVSTLYSKLGVSNRQDAMVIIAGLTGTPAQKA